MKKLILEATIMLALIVGGWLLLSQIPFINEAKFNAMTQKQQAKLGKLLMESITKEFTPIEGQPINTALDSIKNKLCSDKKATPNDYHIILLNHNEVNAFALPGNYIVVFKGLIDSARSADEVAGVLGHEIGHHQEGHIMKRLVKEVGVGILLTVTGGEAGGQIIKEIGGKLLSASFDRSQEREADAFAVKLLQQNHIDPSGLAHFLFRLPGNHSAMAKTTELFSTHPHSKDRAADILKQAHAAKTTYRPVLPDPYWTTAVQKMNSDSTNKMSETTEQ